MDDLWLSLKVIAEYPDTCRETIYKRYGKVPMRTAGLFDVIPGGTK